jgi:hypothetical protein
MSKEGLQSRYMRFMKEKGRLPKSMDDEGGAACMYEGGYVGDYDHEDEEFHDDDWNNHGDTSGEPMDHFSEPPYGFAFGGKVKAKENDESSFKGGLHGHQYGKPTFAGPEEHDEPHEEMSEAAVHHHLAQALKRRKQLKPGA